MVIYDHDDREGTVRLYDLYSNILPDNFTPEMFKQLMMKHYEAKADRDSVEMKFAAQEYVNEEKPEADNEMSFYTNSADIEAKNIKDNIRKIYITGGAVAVLGIAAISLLGTKGVVLSLFMVAVYMIYAINSYKTLIEEQEIRKNIMGSVESRTDYYGSMTGIYSGPDIVKKEIKKEIKKDGFVGQRTGDQKKSISSLVPFISEKELPIILEDGTDIRIGRQPGVNEYCLTEPGISRAHAVISKRGTRVCLRDEGSTNGTYVNNQRISAEETELNYGDVVSFAGVEYYCV